MAYLLRTLILLMLASIALTTSLAMGWVHIEKFGHIKVAIPSFIFTVFAQAFVMFYFIGVARLVENVRTILTSGQSLDELFEKAPADLKPYREKVQRFHHEAELCKRQTIPWTMLMLVLGMIAFFLGGAHDTGMVAKHVHSGVVYGFAAAMIIGFFRQWYYLGKSHKLLRELKTLFQIPDGQM
jgi:ABC-type multidrug transport system fused ATPase/permease subunit